MARKQFWDRCKIDLSLGDELCFNPYYQRITTGITSPRIGGRVFVDLASNNYLGLAGDERVKKAIIAAVETFGASMCGTPIATGSAEIYAQLERRLTDFVGLEAGLLFPSGYQANSSLFPALARPGDEFIVDHYAHASLIQGLRANGCRIRPFQHNEMGHLEGILKRNKAPGQLFVVTESVFSTEGSIAPCDEIMEICRRYEALPVIDDSHGIGVIGKTGRGILEEKNISGYDGIYTASLGKALANAGGIVCGPTELINYLRYSCAGLLYSTALTPAIAAGLDKVLDILKTDFAEMSRKLWMNKRTLTSGLQKSGYRLAGGTAPITSIICGSTRNTIVLAKRLYDGEILSTPFVPPSVPPEKGCVRLIAGAHISESQLENVLHVIGRAELPVEPLCGKAEG